MDDNYKINGHDLLHKWFGSDVWTNICECEDEDSAELMETVSTQLESLIFHVQNQSGDERIQYELSFFSDLCNQFDVPIW